MNTSVHLFQSLPTNTFSLTLQIQHHITNEHYSPHFCSPLSITSNQHILTHSPNPTSHHKRTLLKTLLFTSFNHFQPTHSHSLSKSNITSQTNITHAHFCSPLSITSNQHILTHSPNPTSHHKRTLLITLLFTSFNHFQPTHSHSLSKSNITSQTNITHHTSVHLFQSLPTNTFLTHSTQSNITSQTNITQAHFCSPLSITSKQHILTHSTKSNITSQTNITHNTSVHLFQSLPTNTFSLTLQIQHHITNEHYS